MKKTLLCICRLIPALTFIFSGIVKAIDPVGGAVKFEDYFVAFGMDALAPLALGLSIALASLEFLIGFFLLCRLYMRITSLAALIMTAFFTLLTLYIAIFNPVSDCGCFGDAIKLTNWETFGKNVILMAAVFFMFKFRNSYENRYTVLANATTAIIALVAIISFSVYNYRHLPVIDFRPYKTGTNIPAGMRIPEGAEQPEYETLFILEKDGVRQTFNVDNYPYDDESWVYVDSETKVIKEGYTPPLYNFSIFSAESGEEVHHELINTKGPVFLVISPDLAKISDTVAGRIGELAENARIKNISFHIVTASGNDAMENFDKANGLMLSYLQADETLLKTIIRSNPGLVLLYDGTVAGKWHYNDLPEVSILENPLSYALTQSISCRSRLIIWLCIAGVLLIPLIIFRSKTTK